MLAESVVRTRETRDCFSMHLFLWNSIWLAKNEANAVLCDGPNQGLWGIANHKMVLPSALPFSPLTTKLV